MDQSTTLQEVVWLGTTYKTKLSAAQTGGRLSIFESLDQPGYGPPRHIHKAEDETFYILAGEVEFWQAGRTTHHGPGEVVFIEQGAEHTFRIIGDMPARMVTVMSPGGFEGFFAEMAARQFRIPQDMAHIAVIGAKYNLEFTGPPLGR
jgi:quercetin dioxygenase-like cupin family protein